LAADTLKPLYTSGQWSLDLDRRELRLRGAILPLGGRAFDVIEVLFRAAGDLVSKDELMAAVWPGTFVEENTIQVHISALRKALGADRELLRTISGRGYRLLGNWTNSPDSAAHAAQASRLQPVPPRPQGNLPAAGSQLIGRATPLRHLRDLLSAYRAVTVTGPGGIGKTRLALEVARDALGAFDGDVWLIELAALVDPTLVPSTVVATLNLELRGNFASPDAVARAIGGRRLLLVLDNCEHVIDAAARLAETLLRTCPGVTLLATSREKLEIEGEYAYRVPTLDVPPFGSADLLDSSAVQMFLARGRASGAEAAARPQTLEVIAAICRRLDGIPLAIEFAAARAALLGLQEVLARLDDRFALLTGGRRTALPRHQTLRATLDWSYDLLSEPERRLLRALSVFAGGFTLDAAAAVSSAIASPAASAIASPAASAIASPAASAIASPAASAIASPAASAIDGVTSLASKSLLDREGSSSRWRLLETTRAFALEKLAQSGERAEAVRRHADFFRIQLAPHAQSTGREPDTGALPFDARDIDNIRAALDWAFSSDGDAAIGVGLTIGAVPLWVRLSLVDECRGRVERALASLGRDLPDDPRSRMQLSAALGWSSMFAVGRARETSAAWSTTLRLAEALADTGYRLRALWGLWVDALNNGAFRNAADLAGTFASLVAESSDAIDRMMADRMQATSLHYLGDQPNARRHIEVMLGRPEVPAQDPQSVRFQFDQRVTAHYFQARILWLLGLSDQAMRVVETNLAEAEPVANALSFASVLGQGACVIALLTGDWAAADRHGAKLLQHADRHGLKLWHAWARAFNAAIMVRQGRVAEGLHSLRTEIALAAEARTLPRYQVLIAELASAYAEAGEPALALQTVDDAIERCEADEGRWYLPELLRIRGESIRRIGAPDSAAVAADDFRRALDCAHRQGALSWALRAAVSLARLLRDKGEMTEARTNLSAIYARFSEGFGTADLQAARMLLAELA
jgi:predicted ATPase/DNA-binding winged helix-turn-helix (wHTH) protein